jgi:hypothetical protein
MSELKQEVACFRCGGTGLEYKRRIHVGNIVSPADIIKDLQEQVYWLKSQSACDGVLIAEQASQIKQLKEQSNE